MPFRSERQRRYLWANRPDVARKWSKKYGSAPIGRKATRGRKRRGRRKDRKRG